jgi:predicted nucleic acid-binding protein
MILTPDNEYTVLLDACVLAPMPLCDTLLRLAEEPAFYRPLWSETILQEVGSVLERWGHTPAQRERRLGFMRLHFPEACVDVPAGLLEAFTCVPDPNDRHVLAAAVRGHANAIITLNERDFPEECLKQYDMYRQSPDEFLIHQFHLSPELVLEKIDAQAIAIRQSRRQVIKRLDELCQAPKFTALLRKRSS